MSKSRKFWTRKFSMRNSHVHFNESHVSQMFLIRNRCGHLIYDIINAGRPKCWAPWIHFTMLRTYYQYFYTCTRPGPREEQREMWQRGVDKSKYSDPPARPTKTPPPVSRPANAERARTSSFVPRHVRVAQKKKKQKHDRNTSPPPGPGFTRGLRDEEIKSRSAYVKI